MRRITNVLVISLLLMVSTGLGVVFIGKIREAGRRLRCHNNLRLIGISLNNYLYPNESFPAGTVSSETLPPEKRLSWLVTVQPYLGKQLNSWDIDKTKAWDSPENIPITGQSLALIFHCPSYPGQGQPDSPGRTHYVGIAGVGPDSAALPKEDPRAGVFGYDRRTSLKDIKDGTSTTLLVAETAWENGPWAAGGPATVRGLDLSRQPYVGRGQQFGGTHPGGVNVLFADVSVRFLNESIDPHVFEALTTYAGGEKVGKLDTE